MHNQKKIYIGLVGEASSGKDTIAKFLEKHFQARILTSSFLLKTSLKVFIDEFSRKDLIWYVRELTKHFGDDIISKAMVKSMRSFDDKVVVFNGVRLPSDYEMLRKQGASLIYITAGSKLRWKRSVKRQEKTDDGVPYDEFMDMQKSKTEINVPAIGEKADYKIVNDGTLKDLENKAIAVMKEIIEKNKKE